MKYDDLDAFNQYIFTRVQNPNTARKYYGAVVKLFRNVDVKTDIKKMDSEFFYGQIPALFKSRNEISAIKNGLKYFEEFLKEEGKTTGLMGREPPAFPGEDYYHEVNQKKRNFSKKPKKTLYYDEICRKVNQIQDEKLRYAYRLALVSGLRVSELAGLEAEQLSFENGLIFVDVKNGKGGSNGIVECIPDTYLYERLQQYASIHSAGKLFYAEATLRKRAWELELECHDFRRIFAITKRNRLRKEVPLEEANRMVQEGLRHKRFSTTKRYLFNRKLVLKSSGKEGQK